MSIEPLLLLLLLLIITPLLGTYLAWVFTGRCTFLRIAESVCYKIAGVDPSIEMSAWEYAKQLFSFTLLGFIGLFLLLVWQDYLPLNPQHLPAVSWSLAFNIASSFVTNTNWQSYAPETTLSYFSQMAGLTVQNFLSAATGLCALLVLTRGLIRRKMDTVGNFWADLVRSILYLFLPLAIVSALILVSQGVIQNELPYINITTLEGMQTSVPMGPAASQIAIKQLGTNGGGFFNANSAHPFENPTALSNLLETFFIVMIPAALVYMYGIMINSKKRGLVLFTIMLLLWAAGLGLASIAEETHNPLFNTSTLLEGKETRFGVMNSLVWSTVTTCTANGSTNVALSSLSPLAGGVSLFNIMLEELIFGGVGVGLASMIMFVILTIFLSGLMVGRTPEYLGKKIERTEVQWAIFAILTPSALILLGTGISIALPETLGSISNLGPHGLTEILYAFASCAGNNGSAFAGFNANTEYYNIALGMIMLISRVAILLPSIAIGGLLVNKKVSPLTAGTLTTNTVLFAFMLTAVILIISALTFFPALALGPIAEQFLMSGKRAF